MLGLSSSDQSVKKRDTFSRLRILRDLTELHTLPSTCAVTLVDPNDVSQLIVTISPDDGFYKGGRFIFSIVISDDYPCTPPKVKCTQTIYHPNIDLKGNVCLNILREDWKPILSIVTVVLGLVFLFLEPNPDDPLNQDAAALFKQDIDRFKFNVTRSMRGENFDNVEYDDMKKGKVAPVIVETKVGKFLLRDFRPPIQLRTSPRKMKTKIKKDLKRLDENFFGLSTNKKRKNKVKKQLNFHEDNQEEEEKEEEESSLFIIFNNEQDIEFNEDELTNTKSILCFVNSKTRRMLIFSPRSCRITLLGVFTLEQIFGSSANLHGFTLELSQRYPIFNLSSQSLMSIETTTSKTSLSENQIRTFFDNYQLQFSSPDSFVRLVQKFAKVHHDLSVFHIEQLQTTWIESMKEFSQSHLANQWLFNNKTNSDEDEQTQNNENFKQLWPGMGIFKNSYTQSITYSADIQSITNSIISRLSTKTTSDPLVVFVCGAKDSGKSTYLRYLINRCLSQSSHPKITFLDSDIGQSEFTPSGCISLINNLHQPLFGPAASHLTKPLKSFYFGNIKVENDKLIEYLNYVKYLYDFIQNQRQDLLVVNTMGWGSDSGLVIMKELIDLIKPDILIQLRSSNPHFRHIMPNLDSQWSLNASISEVFRQNNRIPMNYSYNHYEYHLLLTPVRQHTHGKSNLTRQACLWSYFSQLETKHSLLKPFIDYLNHIHIFSFEKLGIGLLHRQIQPKYFLQVLNGSIIGLCRVKTDMLYYPSNSYPALIDERANLECFGFGFIRSIDMNRREIHVIIPDHTLPKSMINALIKGYDDCPEEFYFMSIDRWRGQMPPYVTGLISSTT